MADDERKSGAKGNPSKEIGYTSPPEENKEQKQTKSKPTFFSMAST